MVNNSEDIAPAGRVQHGNGGLRISFAYDVDLVGAVRSIPGSRWNRRQKVWTCPLSSLPEVMDVLGPQGFIISPDLSSQRDAILGKRALRHARRQREKTRLEEANAALQRSQGELAFVPAGNTALTRRIKAAGVFAPVKEETEFGSTVIGYELPETTLAEILEKLGRPSDVCARLLELLRYLFRVNVEAQQYRSWFSTAVTRYGKKEHLLCEVCRLAAKQARFSWGWKKDPQPPPNGAEWVVYFEADGKQISFHTFERGTGPDFAGEWNGLRNLEFPW